jgi:predicted nucleic acid-binding protein
MHGRGHDNLILDACCMINLYAAGDLESLLPPMRFDFHIPETVLRESLFVRKLDEEEGKLVEDPIDLKPAIDEGLLRECKLQEGAETELFVQLATAVDDGEAMCLAIAKTRGWMLATDDRKATRLANKLGVKTTSTPELMKRWADASKAKIRAVAQALDRIQTFARFVPRKGSRLQSWWNSQLKNLKGD